MPYRRIPTFTLILSILLSVATTLAWADDLRLQLDRDRLSAGETLTMQLVADGAASGEPDFTPLTQDFEILSQRQSKVMSIVNGSMSNTRQWALELAPRRPGRLTIPALSLGDARTRPVTVEVVTGADSGPQAGPKPMYVEAEAATSTPYVQQAFDYRVSVFFRVQPQRAVLSEPVAEGATIQQSGEDRTHEKFIDGQRYTVIERTYLVIPQQSGTLSIQGPRLEAMVPAPRRGRQRDPFADLDEAFGGTLFQGFPNMPGMGNPGRRLVERARDLEIQVRPQPDGSGSPWLPATSVQISDEWTPSPPVFRVGEPLTRTLTITAQGVTAAQLPALDLGTLDGAQVYPDQPHGEDLSGSPNPTAIKRFKVALVPTRSGSLTLPEIRLPWWDTLTDTPRVVVVPARTVEVAAAPAGTAEPPPVTASAAAETPVPSAEPEVATPAVSPSPTDAGGGVGDAGPWPWLALILGLAWLGTLGWWLRERRARRSPEGAPGGVQDRRNESLGAARRRIEKACLSGDARAARVALMTWGQLRWPDQAPQGLGDLGVRLGDEGAGDLLASIDRAIYAPSTEAWDGAAAWKGLAALLGAANSGGSGDTADPLPDLYPRM